MCLALADRASDGTQVIDITPCRALKELTIGLTLPIFVDAQCTRVLDDAARLAGAWIGRRITVGEITCPDGLGRFAEFEHAHIYWSPTMPRTPDGRVHAAGPVEEVLTAENLSEAFGTPLTVERSGDRWTARGRS